MKKILPWLLGAVLAVAAGIVTISTPTDAVYRAPFPIRAENGEQATSRTLSATMLDASFADRVTVPESDWHADGNWLVITLSASAPHTEVDADIKLATLLIDGRVFQASERPRASLLGIPLHIGLETEGTLAFELPADLRTGNGELRLSTSYITPRLDDVVALPISLDTLPTARNIDLDASVLGES